MSDDLSRPSQSAGETREGESPGVRTADIDMSDRARPDHFRIVLVSGDGLESPSYSPMPLPTRRRLLIALPLALLLAVGVIIFASGKGLQSRLAEVKIGMTQAEVEAILGPPALVLPRTNGRGHLSAWVDQFWQVDVITGPDGRVERVSCMPSDSAYHRTIGRLL